MGLTTIALNIKEFLFPAGCALCGSPFLSAGEISAGVCSDCASGFKPETGERCLHCGRPLISETGICVECRGRPAPAYDRAYAIHRYGGAPRRLLASYKFGSGRNAASFIAGLFSDAVALLEAESGMHLTMVPVPPRKGKIRKTGWDQIEAVCAELCAKREADVRRCLVRLPSDTQKKLNYLERVENMRGKIRCARAAPDRAVVFDDVLTTGTTLDACARALKDAGSGYVAALALCYD